MTRMIKVTLWGKEIGRLAWDSRRGLSYFTFNPDIRDIGWDIAPLSAPISKIHGGMPIWGETARIYQQLPAFIADSLPDAWGNQLFEHWRNTCHIAKNDITPLDKLSFIGKRGMGALEFEPETIGGKQAEKINIHALIDLAQRIFVERENAQILPEESLTMQALIAVGTSAGGRQPKAIIAINRNTGEIRSGQIAGQEGFEYCILKFGDAAYSSAELEMTYYEMAVKAGIDMMPSELITVEGKRHFLTKRFDRQGSEKLHTQTLAAISPEACSYEDLLLVCRKLHLPESDCEEVFRRLVFNYLANNTDDHNKNFSFIMSRQGQWRLSPAYDMTYILDSGGYLPNRQHCLFLRGKLSGVTKHDILAFAHDNGVRKAESIICTVAASLSEFREIATRNGVSDEWTGRVEACLRQHLEDWQLTEKSDTTMSFTLSDGTVANNVRLEQAYKGNIHLYATIGNMPRKYIIRKGTAEYNEMTKAGIAHVSEQRLKELFEHVFFSFCQRCN